MKETIAATLIALIALMSFGCVSGTEFTAEPVALAKNVPERPPVPLDQITAGKDAAFAFAAEKYDSLAEDKYLSYIVNAKDRDDADRAKQTAFALQLAVAQAEADLTGQTEQSSTSGGNPTSSGGSSVNSGSSGATSEASADDGAPDSSERYYDTASGYSIAFPAGWVNAETTFGDFHLVAAVSPPAGDGDQILENIGVTVEGLPIELSSGEYLDMVILVLDAGLRDFQVISRSDFTLDGRSGKKLVFSYTKDGKAMKDAFYEVVKGSSAYVIIATADAAAYSEYENRFDNAAGSFKFEN